MKEKRNYSLTAKERKARRLAENNKTVGGKKQQQAPDRTVITSQRESAERVMLTAQKRSRLSAVILTVVICIAVLLIIAALIVPVILYIVNPYRGYKDVIARFDLSNGMVLEFVIEEDKYDTAATNFIFLAQNGFFDNTVFYDAQNGWLRFGGYESQPASNASNDYARTHHRAQSESYCKSFSALPNSAFKETSIINKFGYRLKADNGGTTESLFNREGILTFRYSDTATEFQMTYNNQPTNEIKSITGNSTSYNTLASTMVGHALNTKTIDNIKSIASVSSQNSNITSGNLWCPPNADVKINSVKVYNLNDAKWRDMNFLAYMRDGKRVSQWTGIGI